MNAEYSASCGASASCSAELRTYMPCAGGSATVDGLRLPRSARPEKQQSSTTITDAARHGRR
ncbi:hypothetical protein ACIPW9_10920 [Streptomyces sp. NPDC090052]|uniref:hypothetical protein n=1 Tax=unclassified Streptomyces TaxID=2593676 RepID=UPI002258FAC0|nr:hypothetical protein [Streptomyces sp. NBC_01306]MCX4725677.1 hypothetical protein [Streptomyces sp. NBC_01306]